MSAGTKPGSILCSLVRGAGLLALLMTAEVHAGAIYKCSDASKAPVFQATPCAANVRQAVMHVRGQPLLDAEAPAPPMVRAPHAGRAWPGKSLLRRRGGPRHVRAAQATSWECRAADGEVFYRHAGCPHSVPGDGVMRSGGTYALHRGSGGRSRTRSAWDPVPVHARRVSRSEACKQINAVAAVDRDGHARDERVSVYEHDVGRDPCSGY